MIAGKKNQLGFKEQTSNKNGLGQVICLFQRLDQLTFILNLHQLKMIIISFHLILKIVTKRSPLLKLKTQYIVDSK